MRVTSIKLKNVRGYISDDVTRLSKNINILIGANNAGKTTFLKSLFFIQGNALNESDITLNQQKATVEIAYDDGKPDPNEYKKIIEIELRKGNPISKYYIPLNEVLGKPIYKENSVYEPNNAIYPYFSKRKVVSYNEIVNYEATYSVIGNFSNLYAKIDRISAGAYPAHKEFTQACLDILGFEIATVPTDNGKKGAYIVSNFSHIALESMGEGVVNLLGLIVDLCVAENKIFLIEEPENDIHPKALKALLALIEKKSNNNQFIISTHSNIVTKYLGSVNDSKVFNVDMLFDPISRLPISTIKEIPNDIVERRNALESLGYDIFDYDLWKAWLFLEEASAETIIREYLIPTYIPKLKGKLKTFSASGRDKIKVKFNDFNKLFVFLHLEPSYKNRVWVIIDSGSKEDKIINDMKEMYLKSGWKEDQFLQFSEHDFENYYPSVFKDQVKEALSSDKKQEAKRQLLNNVLGWIKKNPEEAKQQFAESAKEVIEILKEIVDKI